MAIPKILYQYEGHQLRTVPHEEIQQRDPPAPQPSQPSPPPPPPPPHLQHRGIDVAPVCRNGLLNLLSSLHDRQQRLRLPAAATAAGRWCERSGARRGAAAAAAKHRPWCCMPARMHGRPAPHLLTSDCSTSCGRCCPACPCCPCCPRCGCSKT